MLEGHRRILRLLEELCDPAAALDLAHRTGIEVAGAELSEGLELAELGQL